MPGGVSRGYIKKGKLFEVGAGGGLTAGGHIHTRILRSISLRSALLRNSMY